MRRDLLCLPTTLKNKLHNALPNTNAHTLNCHIASIKMSQEAVNKPATIKNPRTIAAEYIAQRHFHRRFILPQTATHGDLPVTYADIGKRPETSIEDVPTFLFMPGMFGSRYVAVYMHAIAEKLGVRVLIVDR